MIDAEFKMIKDYFAQWIAPTVKSPPKPHPLMSNVQRFLGKVTNMASHPGLAFVPANRRLLEQYGSALYPWQERYLFEPSLDPEITMKMVKLDYRYVPDWMEVPASQQEAFERQLWDEITGALFAEIDALNVEHSWNNELVHPYIPLLTSVVINPETLEPNISFATYYGVSKRKRQK